MTFYPKKWIIGGVYVHSFEKGTKFPGESAEPSGCTGGTHVRVPRDPWGEIWKPRF